MWMTRRMESCRVRAVSLAASLVLTALLIVGCAVRKPMELCDPDAKPPRSSTAEAGHVYDRGVSQAPGRP
jgi:hypothetical protein